MASISNKITVSYEGPDKSVAVIKMDRGENRLNNGFLKQFLDALEQIEKNRDVKALVTIGEGKFFSNGLDLNAFVHYTNEDLAQFDVLFQSVHKRLITFPVITIAAINGHAYAAGGILALAHDIIIMKEERGWFCLPEIKINRTFTISTMELVRAKLPKDQFVDAILMGRRYTGREAKDAGIIHQVVPGSDLLCTAIERGVSIGREKFDRDSMETLKNDLYYSTVKAFSQPAIYYSKL